MALSNMLHTSAIVRKVLYSLKLYNVYQKQNTMNKNIAFNIIVLIIESVVSRPSFNFKILVWNQGPFIWLLARSSIFFTFWSKLYKCCMVKSVSVWKWFLLCIMFFYSFSSAIICVLQSYIVIGQSGWWFACICNCD